MVTELATAMVYPEALSDDDLQPLATAGVSIADLVRGSRNCQDKLNNYDRDRVTLYLLLVRQWRTRVYTPSPYSMST